MARIGVLLLLLIQWSNVYAWYCNFTNGEDGWYLEGSMQCVGIDNQVALEQEYCGWFRPQDPICSEILQPVCVDSIEYQTLSCPTNYSGGIQQSRTYVCQQASWTNWTTTSDNCTPDPPTCVASSDSRTLACPSGYEGQITETRVSQCPDPYGEPQWLEWQQNEYTCTQNISDPVSPISVTSPTNPVTSIVTESVTAPIIDVPQTNNPSEPTIESVAQEELSNSSDDVEQKTNNKTDSPKEVKQDKQDGNNEKSKNNKDEVVDNPKEIVHGFGLVLSLDILQKPMEFYQPPLEDIFSITQEFPLETRLIEEFYSDVLRQDYLENYYIGNSNSAWDRLRRSDILQ
jgi:hypothetical protein